MLNNINKLKLPLREILELGKVDSWLRGIADITPRSLPEQPYNMNLYTLAFSGILIGPKNIHKMSGFQKLLKASLRNDVRVDVRLSNEGSIEVQFDPESSFSKSTLFGEAPARVLPFPKNMAFST